MQLLDRIWFLGLLGAFFYWLSLPPLHQPWAAFLACMCWVRVVDHPTKLVRHDYLYLWLAACGMWLALLHGIRLAYWPLYAGWLALSLYVAVYLPLFVVLAKSLRSVMHFSLVWSSAIAWVACEWARAYFATGFAACMLAHSQVPWPFMLPIASHLGSYGVSLLVMLISAVLYQWITYLCCSPQQKYAHIPKWQALLANSSTTLLVVCIVVGQWFAYSMYDAWLKEQQPLKPLGRIMLIQEHMPTIFDGSLEDVQTGWDRYVNQMAIAFQTVGSEPIDLVVWPESTFSGGLPWFDTKNATSLPPEFQATGRSLEELLAGVRDGYRNKIDRISLALRGQKPCLLAGSDVYRIQEAELSRFNAGIWINLQNPHSVDYYAKGHLVMFGEYIPVLSWFPEWQAYFGLGALTAGTESKAWPLPSGAYVSPTICFEDVLPHVVRDRVQDSVEAGTPPDLMINITNDGWFRGSSILDHHLNNAILCAVENRRPMLVAANTGITAWIDGSGRVVQRLPKMDGGQILAEPIPDGRWGWWQSVGDRPAFLVSCLAFFALTIQLIRSRSKRNRVRDSIKISG